MFGLKASIFQSGVDASVVSQMAGVRVFVGKLTDDRSQI